MLTHCGLICCNSSMCFRGNPTNISTKSPSSIPRVCHSIRYSSSWISHKPCKLSATVTAFHRKGKDVLRVCRSSLKGRSSEDPALLEGDAAKDIEEDRNGTGNVNERDWGTTILLFGLWAALIYYVFNLTPNQTPARDMYFLQKLLNLRGDDGFRMNEVLVSLWYILGLWPLMYSMLLLPSARTPNNSIPLWPFLILSFAGGAYILIPYFVFWNPPSPPVNEIELRKWPLNFLESKLTAWIIVGTGVGLLMYGALADGDVWKEFFQYWKESKFIHVSCLDFCLLSTFAPLWVFNDMVSRKWYDKGRWLLPFSLIPFIGTSIYLLLRPTLLSQKRKKIVQQSK